MLRSLLICLSFLCAGTALAQSQSTDIRPDAKRVTGDALLHAFKNVTHEGAYRFSNDGEPREFYSETHHDDGSTTYIEGDLNTTGAWIIRRDSLCFAYPQTEMAGGCFRVYKVGNCYYYYNASLPHYANELDRDYWTARSVKQGEQPNCIPGLS